MLTENIARFISLFWLFLLFLFFLLFYFLNFLYYFIFFFLLSYYFSFNLFSRCVKRNKHVLFISNSFLKMTLVCLLFLLLFCFQYIKKIFFFFKIINPWYVCRRFFADFCVVELLCYTSLMVWSNGHIELLVLVLVHVVWNNNTHQRYQHLDLNWYQDSC